MKIIVDISRILVGTLFIFSGLIKANDPLGFSYKLEEYWIEFGIGWDWLLSIGVPLASFVVILEIVLGVAVLVAYRMNLVTRLLLLMIVFFSILTFASAVFGLVKSCGCFGDAIPLTPWQSFVKDVILMIFIVILFSYKREIKPYSQPVKGIAFVIFPVAMISLASFKVEWNFPVVFTLGVLGIGYVISFVDIKKFPMYTTVLSLIASVWMCYHVIEHLPMKDFRPYAVGKSISEQMVLPEGAVPDVYENVFKYKNLTTGKVEEFNEANYPWDDQNYEFVDRTTTLIEKGDEAKITDFSIIDADGYDLTQDVLNDPDPIVLLISYAITGADAGQNEKVKGLVDACNQNGLSIIGLSASDEASINKYVQEGSFDVQFYATDEITLKTMVRSNPGIILIQGGMVKGKWHANDIPDIAELKSII